MYIIECPSGPTWKPLRLRVLSPKLPTPTSSIYFYLLKFVVRLHLKKEFHGFKFWKPLFLVKASDFVFYNIKNNLLLVFLFLSLKLFLLLQNSLLFMKRQKESLYAVNTSPLSSIKWKLSQYMNFSKLVINIK